MSLWLVVWYPTQDGNVPSVERFKDGHGGDLVGEVKAKQRAAVIAKTGHEALVAEVKERVIPGFEVVEP